MCFMLCTKNFNYTEEAIPQQYQIFLANSFSFSMLSFHSPLISSKWPPFVNNQLQLLQELYWFSNKLHISSSFPLLSRMKDYVHRPCYLILMRRKILAAHSWYCLTTWSWDLAISNFDVFRRNFAIMSIEAFSIWLSECHVWHLVIVNNLWCQLLMEHPLQVQLQWSKLLLPSLKADAHVHKWQHGYSNLQIYMRGWYWERLHR